jgi:predicted enzyme related to lactoylglutathione lyase
MHRTVSETADIAAFSSQDCGVEHLGALEGTGEAAMTFEGLNTIGQVHVSVTDVDRSVAFYREVLGIPFLFRVTGQPMAFFECGDTRLYLGVPESEEYRSRAMLYFTVEDVDEAYETLADRGVEFRGAPHIVHRTETTELRMAFFSDPDGNNLALMGERPVAEAPS